MRLALSLVVVITAVSFLPSLFNDFVNWDDRSYVVNNPEIKEISWQNIKKMFTSSYVSHYCPLVILSFAVEHHFFELNPTAYHATNYVLHLLITVLVFAFIYSISGSVTIASVVSLLFGVHPLHVESVAWVTERKDLLYAVLYMPALLFYQRYIRTKTAKDLGLCALFVVLSLFSKASAISLPFVFLLLDYYYGRKIRKDVLLEKLPFLGLAVVFAAVNLKLSTSTGAATVILGHETRVYLLSKAPLFYIAKLFFPVNLSALYPYHLASKEDLLVMPAFIILQVVLFACIIVSGRRTKKIIFGSAFFMITILPILQLVPVGTVYVADRYAYIPSIGIFFILGAGFAWLLRSDLYARFKAMRFAIAFLSALLVGTLSVMTWNRCKVWKNTGTLFQDVIKQYPNNRLSYLKVANFSTERGDLDEAEKYYKKALDLKDELELVSSGCTLTGVIRDKYEKLLEQKKFLGVLDLSGAEEEASIDSFGLEDAKRYNERGRASGVAGNLDEALRLFREAEKAYPDYAETYNNIGYVYFLKNEYEAAEKSFKKAIEIDPGHEKARYNLEFMRKKFE